MPPVSAAPQNGAARRGRSSLQNFGVTLSFFENPIKVWPLSGSSAICMKYPDSFFLALLKQGLKFGARGLAVAPAAVAWSLDESRF